jgi:hypothetical protein
MINFILSAIIVLNCFTVSEKKVNEHLGGNYFVAYKTKSSGDIEFSRMLVCTHEYFIVAENSDNSKPSVYIDDIDLRANTYKCSGVNISIKVVVKNLSCGTVVVGVKRKQV